MDSTLSDFAADETCARRLDAIDPLHRYRDEFLIPRRADGQPVVYLCGHSLGLQPRAARALVEQELDDWAALGVDAHFAGRTPWYAYHEVFRETGARLVGARPGEVVFMNGLTVNLHLMLATFYRPRSGRGAIVIDEPAFPSDRYAVASQIALHCLDPAKELIALRPRKSEHVLRTEDVEEVLEERGAETAVVLLNAVNFFTGQYLELPRLAAAARRQGCVIGLDLAHAAGNVPLALHDWGVDFAVWCGYKYLNGGPGCAAGCFVHEKHGNEATLPRLAGWWGNDPATRFHMHLQPDFVPRPGADGWQLSNPSILAMAPLRASLALFEEAGMSALRDKSERLTGYMQYLLDRLPPGRFELLTPRDPDRRGCQLSMLVRDEPRRLLQALATEGVVCDFREPNVIRVAPVPLYNTFEDVWRFVRVLERWSG